MGVKENCLVWTIICVFLLFCQVTTQEVESTQDRSAECPNNRSDTSLNWRLYHGSCYVAYPFGFFNYEAGKEFCRRNGASLASVHSMDEMRFIITLAEGGTNRFWIGLRKNYPSEYQWEDGSAVDFVNWSPDDDDDYTDYNDYLYAQRLDNLDKCASFRTPGGSWTKGPCDEMHQVICKYTSSGIPIAAAVAPLGNCPEGWYTFGDNCYNIGGRQSSESKGWHDAGSHCEALGSYLVSVHSEDEQDFLNRLTLDVRNRMWIGLSRPSSREEFSWNDGSPIDYSNWDEGEPNNHLDTEENCVQLLERFSDLGEWNDAPCRLKFPYICKKTRDPTITQESHDPSFCAEPAGWLKIRNSCYKVLNEAQSPTPWTQAQYTCANKGAVLASVKTFVVTVELRTHMKDMDGYFWIGLSNTAKHKYSWIGGIPLIYTNWESDQPKDVSDEANCVAMNTEGEWMVRNCNDSLPFICEVAEEPIDPPAIPRSSNMTCPKFSPKWHDFGGKYCYIIEVKQKVRSYEAACLCSKEGGYLASFHSTNEIDLMVHYLQDFGAPLHIGLERNLQGHFFWSDGSPTDFDNWNRGQPDSDREQCAAMVTATGKWNDIHCSERHGYICSVIKVPLEKTRPPSSESLKSDQHSSSMIATISVCTLSLLVIATVALCYYYPSLKEKFAGKMPFTKIES